MSTQRVAAKARNGRKAADDPTILSFVWPIIFGVLFTFLALRIAGMLVLMGQEQFALLYPWVALVRSPVLRIDYGSAVVMGQVLMYLQFPIYGFIVGAVLYMSNSFTRAFFALASVHLVALIAFIAISIFVPS